MKNKKLIIGLAALTTLISGFSYAGSTTISTKYEQTFRENQDYKVKFGLGHTFDNAVAFSFEHQRRWRDEISGRPELAENLFGLGYSYALDDDNRWSLQPKIEYKFNPGSETMRPMLRLNYRINDDWRVGGRYRYEYQTFREGGGARSRVNRFDGYVSYAVTDQIGLAWNTSYAYVLGEGNMYTGNEDRWEHELGLGYRIDRANSLALTYKRKDKTRDEATYNGGRHNDAVQVTYNYRF
ncbi:MULTISPECIES: oligogalacturonate-specific porin KdgM family protein [unclassified Halomonas]|uniref:oligogalacturonate-specific porin KdgM family protein n=1 Tax=unclassified Halomonas TaxID=2609666 RepID=UPI00209D19AB|nr:MULTISPECIES: oligogalacturonate-specific porin KdgM family protein [unclassified Halomonas]MCP1312878.1 oligogalacturonate-specific porin KdgM family protein [Halomonas sp. 707D7]MCP1325176.1 oligogalacturonate-specific porin KdgM family protein [Halomonas sp. 707D4]